MGSHDQKEKVMGYRKVIKEQVHAMLDEIQPRISMSKDLK